MTGTDMTGTDMTGTGGSGGPVTTGPPEHATYLVSRYLVLTGAATLTVTSALCEAARSLAPLKTSS
jgi:hypothetical protein